MGTAPRQIVFLADSELLLEGLSGSEEVLIELRAESRQMLKSALELENPREITAFVTPQSRFGRPLPGAHVARELLQSVGFSGKIRINPDAVNSEETGSEPVPLWLVLGTGSASRGPNAPLVAEARAEEVDLRLSRLLQSATWPRGTSEIDADLAAQVGATLSPSLMSAGRAAEFAAFEVANYVETQQFGVTYFGARWIKTRGSQS